MDQSLTLLIFAVILAVVVTLVAVAIRLSSLKKDTQVVDLLKADITELSRTVQQLSQSMSERLDRNNTAMQSSVQKQLAQSSKLIADVTQRLTKLDDTNRRVVDVASELKTLQNVLSNPKQRGVFGEFYLESVLENVLPPSQFQMQYGFKDGQVVDAVVFLDKGKVLPVDSKFSLENYNRMVEADKESKESFLQKVRQDLKGRIDETAKYIKPQEGTMDFAFMFIPSEALYYDLLINDVGSGSSSRDLIEYAFRDKRVIIVSPTSFLAYLQTVLQGLRSLQIEEQARDIQVRVGQLSVHLQKFDELLSKMGKSLSVTVGHYNNSYKELSKIDKDVVRISGGNTETSAVMIDKPQQEN